MSRRGRGALAGVLLLTLAVAGPSRAPEGAGGPAVTPEGRSPLLDVSLDSLRRAYRDANREADEARARWRAARRDSLRARVDTAWVGPMRVVARPEHMEWAVELFREVWEGQFARSVGDSVRPLRETTFGFEVGTGSGRDRLILSGETEVVRIGVFARWWFGGPEGAVARALGQALAQGLPTDWAGIVGNDVRIGLRDPSLIYRKMVTAPSISARRCLGEDATECWVALGIEEVEEPALRWYTPEERRLAVRRVGSMRLTWMEDFEACVHGGSDRACVRHLERGTPLPLDSRVTHSLVSFALDAGGAGAYQRLLAASDRSLPEALGEAAGMDPDALVSVWVGEIRGARPDRRGEARRSSWATLLWIVVFAALAMRSTRWRLA